MRRLAVIGALIGVLLFSLAGFLQAGEIPQGVHPGWELADVNHTMSVTWYTETSETAVQFLYDTESRGGDPALYRFSVEAEGPTPIIGRKGDVEGYTYTATATDLEAGTTYYFVVGGPDGFTEEFKFRTVPENPDRLVFAVGGDTRKGALDFPEGRNRVAQLLSQHDPYFMIHVGDFIERAFEASEWKEYTRHLQEFFVDSQGHLIPIVPIIGNHEVGRTGPPEGDYTVPSTGFYEFEVTPEDARLYYQFMMMPKPKRWYVLDLAPYLKFFEFDSETYCDPVYPETEQYSWMVNQLAKSSDVTWKIAGCHRPPFAEYGGSGKSVHFLPLLDEFEVDVFVSGHEHFYARTHPLNFAVTDGSYLPFGQGTTHMIVGGGGAPLSEGSPKWFHACGPVRAYSYAIFEVSPDAIHVTAYDDTDRIVDEFTIRKDTTRSETFLRTRGETSYADDVTGPAPLVPFGEGSYPPIGASCRVGKGAVIAAGLAWNCINGQWKLGQLDVLFDIMFQYLKPGATKVLWYEGYGVAHNTEACSELVTALENLGYTVVGDATEPITEELLAGYDILVIPQLRLGSPYAGGDPSQLPWEDVEVIRKFVAEEGKGLLVMDAHDYGGNNWAFVQNKILEGVGAAVALQSDGVYDWVDNWQGRGWQPMGAVDPSTAIGAAYAERTGGTEIELWEVSTVIPTPPLFLERIPGGERSIVDGRRTGADARVIIETLAGGEGYVRIQKAPPTPVKKAVEASYGAPEEKPAAQPLVVVDVSTDVPAELIKWPVTVEVYYTQDAFEASGIASERSLRLYYWDPEQQMWRACPESGVNVERNCVAAAAYHLTRFAILPAD